MRFTNKTVLVTGATSGIGRATALAFASEGANVVAAGRRTSEGDSLIKEIKKTGGQAIFVQTDVSDEKQVKSLIETTLATYAKLDIAFNNAGTEGLRFVNVTDQTVENFHTVMNSNVLGMMLCLKHQISAMLKTGGGAIINNASALSMVGGSGMSVYVASKHAVLGITRSAALEVAKQGIRINAVSPGVVESEMYDRFAGDGSNKDMIAALHPVGRIGKAEEIASVVLFLASEESSFMTGANIAVDGGWTVA